MRSLRLLWLVAWLRTWLAFIALGYAVLTLVLRTLPLTNNICLLIAVSAPYAVLVAMATFVVAVLRRRVVLSLVALLVVAMSFGVQLNWYFGCQTPRQGDGLEVRILSVNLPKGRAEIPSVADLARNSADVVMLTELTPDWVHQFYDVRMRDVFPHSVLVPGPDAGGIGIWSRYPLRNIAPLKGREHDCG